MNKNVDNVVSVFLLSLPLNRDVEKMSKILKLKRNFLIKIVTEVKVVDERRPKMLSRRKLIFSDHFVDLI